MAEGLMEEIMGIFFQLRSLRSLLSFQSWVDTLKVCCEENYYLECIAKYRNTLWIVSQQEKYYYKHISWTAFEFSECNDSCLSEYSLQPCNFLFLFAKRKVYLYGIPSSVELFCILCNVEGVCAD